MKEKNKEITFLCYLNRSGSTYLAKLLDEYEEIGVTIESPFPDGIIYKELIIKNKKQLVKKVLNVYNFKFKEWGISPKELIKIILKKNKYPVKFHEIFFDIIKLYLDKNKPNSKKYIYKSSWNYLINHKKVFKNYPNSKFIFIIRDGRAIYNSQKKSLASNNLKPMSENPIKTALLFKKISKCLKSLRCNDWLYVVKYENLIKNKEKEIDNILKFLGVKTTTKTKTKDLYYKKIPEKQKHLHNNLNKPPLKERIYAWKKELKKEEIYIFQKVAGASLIDFGYDIIDVNLTFREKIKVIMKYFLHFFSLRLKDKIVAFKNPKYIYHRIWYKVTHILK